MQRLWTSSDRIVCHVMFCPSPTPFPKQISKHWPRVFETRYEYNAMACDDPISLVLKSLQAVFVYRLIITLHCGHALNLYGDRLSPFGVSTSVDLEIPDYLFIYACVCVCVCVRAPSNGVTWESSVLWPYLGSLFHVKCRLSLPEQQTGGLCNGNALLSVSRNRIFVRCQWNCRNVPFTLAISARLCENCRTPSRISSEFV